MSIRFTIEKRHLTDADGHPVPTNSPEAVDFLSCSADDVDEAVRSVVNQERAELIGGVLRFPGFQAVATIRNPSGVYTLQFTPSSQTYPNTEH